VGMLISAPHCARSIKSVGLHVPEGE
jgi:hypothetical protein